MLQENCYIVSDDTGECVVIDCGAFYQHEFAAIRRYIADNGLKPVRLLATHGHLDHNFGIKDVFEAYGLRVEAMEQDNFLTEHLAEQARGMFGMEIPDQQPSIGTNIRDGQQIAFGNSSLQVLHTPGHSPGSVVFWSSGEAVAFTGDTLFRMSIGRTDFEGGSWQQMQQSLQKLASLLPPETRLFSGHGPASVMADELQYNPYLQNLV